MATRVKNAGDHVSEYLSMVGTSEANAEFCIFLFNQMLDNYLCFPGNKLQRFHVMNAKRGFPKLISKKSLMDPSNGYVVDDKCVFGVEVNVIKSEPVIERVCAPREGGPYKHNFTVSQFFQREGCWASEEFSVGDYRWKIWVYPNGYGSQKGHCVSMYLVSVDAKSFDRHQKVNADFCLRIKNKFYDTHRSINCSHWFTSSQQSWGSPEFMSIADMRDSRKGFLVDDCCFLEVEIYGPIVECSESKTE